MDLAILDWIQAHLRCGFLDHAVPAITMLGEAGWIWILLAVVLLARKSTRKLGAAVAISLVLDLILCNLLLRAYSRLVRGGIGTFVLKAQELDPCPGAGGGHCPEPAVPLCPLSQRRAGGGCGRVFVRFFWSNSRKKSNGILQKKRKMNPKIHLLEQQYKTYKSLGKMHENSVQNGSGVPLDEWGCSVVKY